MQGGGFDFVILDLNLPDVDGLTICRELRREPPLSPSAGGGTACPATGRAAQIASLTSLTSSTRAANR